MTAEGKDTKLLRHALLLESGEKQELTDYDCWDQLGRCRPPLDTMELCCMIPY